jgi:hypothetical protein
MKWSKTELSIVCVDLWNKTRTYLHLFLPPVLPHHTFSTTISDPLYLAGSQDSRHAVTVPEGELDLDIDPPGSVTRDPACPQPVVLTGTHHVTHLVRVDGTEILIHLIYSIPLQEMER